MLATKTGLDVHTCQPSSCEVEAGGSEGQNDLQLHGQGQTKGHETLSHITLVNTEPWAQLAPATRKHTCMSDCTFPIPSEKNNLPLTTSQSCQPMTPHPHQPLSTLLKPSVMCQNFCVFNHWLYQTVLPFYHSFKSRSLRAILDLQNFRQCRVLVWTYTLAHLIQEVP